MNTAEPLKRHRKSRVMIDAHTHSKITKKEKKKETKKQKIKTKRNQNRTRPRERPAYRVFFFIWNPVICGMLTKNRHGETGIARYKDRRDRFFCSLNKKGNVDRSGRFYLVLPSFRFFFAFRTPSGFLGCGPARISGRRWRNESVSQFLPGFYRVFIFSRCSSKFSFQGLPSFTEFSYSTTDVCGDEKKGERNKNDRKTGG